MKVVLFAGGDAGRKAIKRLTNAYPEILVVVVWDEETGELPTLPSGVLVCKEACSDDADLMLCSGYGRIVPEDFLQRLPLGGFNAHPSILPSYRGRHAIQWQIANGESEFGLSIHRMTKDIDTGAIVMIERRWFGLESNFSTVSEALADLAADMLVQLMERLLGGETLEDIVPVDREDRYWRKREPNDGKITWESSSKTVLDLVRSTTPAYPAFATREDRTQVSFLSHLASDQPGMVLFSSSEGCLVAARDGVVWLMPDRQLTVGEILK